ncbi:MAG: D-alanine--D-alanine ligase [Mariprofundales bacterium]|nr:D-alanine--D-alanine ligase [Mariprofundales bacterium]
MRVGVLMGGASAEREVSLRSGQAVVAALQRGGRSVVALDLPPDGDWPAMIREAEIGVAFVALHGTLGEDGAIQGLLETIGMPYTGSGVMASAICMNKRVSKDLLHAHSIPVAMDIPLGADGFPVRYPVFVKPVAQGSSVGLHLVTSAAEWAEITITDTSDWLIEMPAKGVEVAVSVLDGEALPCIEVRPASGIYDYAAKYEAHDTRYICPAELPVESQRLCMDQAEMAVALLECRGAPRVDMIVTDGGEAVVLEVNTIPGMTSTSLLPKSAAVAGIGFDALCLRMLASATRDGL